MKVIHWAQQELTAIIGHFFTMFITHLKSKEIWDMSHKQKTACHLCHFKIS